MTVEAVAPAADGRVILRAAWLDTRGGKLNFPSGDMHVSRTEHGMCGKVLRVKFPHIYRMYFRTNGDLWGD